MIIKFDDLCSEIVVETEAGLSIFMCKGCVGPPWGPESKGAFYLLILTLKCLKVHSISSFIFRDQSIQLIAFGGDNSKTSV